MREPYAVIVNMKYWTVSPSIDCPFSTLNNHFYFIGIVYALDETSTL